MNKYFKRKIHKRIKITGLVVISKIVLSDEPK